MIFEEIVLDDIYPLDLIPFQPTTIVDAGACRGLFTILASAHFPNAALICIEPEKDNFARMLVNLDLNKLEAITLCAALASEEGKVGFCGGGFGGAIADESANAIHVPARRLDVILGELKIDSLLLKMDIEGAERLVLPQVLRVLPERTAIFLETHHSSEECARYLSPLVQSGFSETVIRTREGERKGTQYVERMFIRDQQTA